MPSSEVCRSFERVWSATLTIVVSRTDMIAPRITTIAILQTWDSIRGELEVMREWLVPKRFDSEMLASRCFGVKAVTLEQQARL
jgi:hypothetical protein